MIYKIELWKFSNKVSNLSDSEEC